MRCCRCLPSQLLYHGYDFVFMANGWTPGMRILSMRIIRLDTGGEPGFARSLGRALFVAAIYLGLYVTAVAVRGGRLVVRAGDGDTA